MDAALAVVWDVNLRCEQAEGRGSTGSRVCTHSLVVERHHLAAGVPKWLRVVVGGVHPGPFGVDPAHLPLVVSEQSCSGILTL